MPVSILRGSANKCLDGLRNGQSDLTEYPLKSYTGQGNLRLNETTVELYQGVNTVPQKRFQVELGEDAAVHAGLEVPGIIPFLVSGMQLSDTWGKVSPSPLEVGIPNLLLVSGCLIRWIFSRDGSTHNGHRLWGRLSEAELDDLPDIVRPDESIEEGKRESSSYENPSGGITDPEPPEFVEPRAGGLPHEPWNARSIELAESWRVVVPNTTQTIGALLVPPTLTIVGQNFNVLLPGTGARAVAINRVMSQPSTVDYLAGICPWSKGGTPRLRKKHINATLWRFEDKIADELEKRESLREAAQGYRSFWRVHVLSSVAIARRREDGMRLRSKYNRISPQQGSLDRVPSDLNELSDSTLTVGTEQGDVEIVFDTPMNAALASIAVWTGMPRSLTIDEALSIYLPIDEMKSGIDDEDKFYNSVSSFLDL